MQKNVKPNKKSTLITLNGLLMEEQKLRNHLMVLDLLNYYIKR